MALLPTHPVPRFFFHIFLHLQFRFVWLLFSIYLLSFYWIWKLIVHEVKRNSKKCSLAKAWHAIFRYIYSSWKWIYLWAFFGDFFGFPEIEKKNFFFVSMLSVHFFVMLCFCLQAGRKIYFTFQYCENSSEKKNQRKKFVPSIRF